MVRALVQACGHGGSVAGGSGGEVVGAMMSVVQAAESFASLLHCEVLLQGCAPPYLVAAL